MNFFTSDWHLGHDKEFIYKARGFDCIEDHDEAIFENLEQCVRQGDVLYMLGDVMFDDYEENIDRIRALPFFKVLILGNHDTDRKIVRMHEGHAFDEVYCADRFQYKKRQFFLSHIPLMLDDRDELKHQRIVSIHGHTHGKERTSGLGHVNVALDAWDMMPVSLDQIMDELRKEQVGD